MSQHYNLRKRNIEKAAKIILSLADNPINRTAAITVMISKFNTISKHDIILIWASKLTKKKQRTWVFLISDIYLLRAFKFICNLTLKKDIVSQWFVVKYLLMVLVWISWWCNGQIIPFDKEATKQTIAPKVLDTFCLRVLEQ